jgi:mono/diheme cytochrome c family protein
LEASEMFANGASARPLVEGTVARGIPRGSGELYTGLSSEDQFVTELPLDLDRALLERGRNRYEAFCTPCHGLTGQGQGMVVQRGFKQPQSFHEPRLRESPVGYFFNVMTNGFGQMSSYAAQVAPRDRWAIAAYLKALQLSRFAPLETLPTADREALASATAHTDADGGEAHAE